MIRRFLVIAPLPLLTACGGGAASPQTDGAIDREVFIEAYVDLRVAAVESEDFAVSDEARAGILARHGLGAESLLRFAEAHGGDIEFMRQVWNEVERRFEARTTSAAEHEEAR